MAITATNSIAHSPSRFGWTKRLALTAAITAGLVISAPLRAAEYAVGVVTKGTFLLSETANVQRENLKVHGRVGYLPVGTRVYLEDEPKTINNIRHGIQETYFRALSSIGIGGLIREDRFIRVKDKPIAVVVSSYNVALHTPVPVQGEFRKLLDVGRYDGVYLEITGDDNLDYIPAVLHRTNESGDLPEIERVRLWREHVRLGLVIVVKPHTVDEQAFPSTTWGKKEVLGVDFIKMTLDAIGKKVDKYMGPNFLPNADAFQCLLAASAELDVVFKLFHNGLSFNLDLDFKQQDHMFRLQRRKLNTSKNGRTYLMLKNVRCDGVTPERLQQFTLQEGQDHTGKRDFVRLKDWQEDPSKWIISLSGKDAPFRMMRIEGESGYLTALRRLDSFVRRGNSFIAELPPEEKQILLNLILREIASFQNPDLLVSRKQAN